MNKTLVLLGVAMLIATSALAGIIQVPANQPTIQAGINAAAKGDTVLVAENTYYENINFKGKAITVASYFLIDCDATHINNTIIDGSRPSDPNKGSVVSFTSGEDTTSVICGFNITAGTGTVYDATLKIGGGVFCKNSTAKITHNKVSHNDVTYNQRCFGGGIGVWPLTNVRPVVIENNVIESNSLNAGDVAQGGGIFLISGKIKHNMIHQNKSQANLRASRGGAIAAACDNTVVDRPLIYIAENTVMDNQAISNSTDTTTVVYGAWGGGVYIVWNYVQLIGNTITHNRVGGPLMALGGGVLIWGVKDGSLIKDNTISFNGFINKGCIGGGMDVAHCSGVIVQGNHFEGNKGESGGGMADGHNTGCIITDNKFIANTADWGGGLAEWDNTNHSVMNNLIVQNTAHYGGGGYWFLDDDMLFANNIVTKNESRRGGGAACEDSPYFEIPLHARIINNTFTENAADTAGGIFIWDYEVVAMNTICWGNDAPFAPEILVKSGELNVAHSDIRLGADSIRVTEGGTLNWLAGNIDADPRFSDSLSLLDSSPCIGKGIASLDIDGTLCNCPETDMVGHSRPDPAGSKPDIGAYESPLASNVMNSYQTEIPQSYSLAQNYPNPFNPSTTIEFALPKSAFVSLKVYNLLGEAVATLVAEHRSAGIHKLNWDARGLASGVYLYRLEAGEFVQVKKLILMR